MGLFSGVLQGLGARKESQAFNKESKKRTGAALGELTPEAMQHLISLFFSKYYGQLMPQMQGAQGAIGAAAARRGLTGTGATKQLQAGIPGQFGNMALGQSINSALPIASQRAQTQAGREFKVGPSGLSILGSGLKSEEQDFMDLFKSFMGGGGGGAIGGMMM